MADLRNVAEGEGCPNCGSPLKVAKAVEIGHIFKLGYKYSESMGARVLDRDGKEVTPIMGSYGIGIERILTCAMEQNHDELDSICLQRSRPLTSWSRPSTRPTLSRARRHWKWSRRWKPRDLTYCTTTATSVRE